MTQTDFVEEITADHLNGSKVEAIAKLVLNKTEIDDKELELVFKMASMVRPVELTISAAETRQVRQYESNNYHVSMKMNIEDMSHIIYDQMRKAEPADRPAVFDNCRNLMYSLINQYYRNNENVLRDMIRRQQEEDGITAR